MEFELSNPQPQELVDGPTVTTEYLRNNTKIHGWLVLFLLITAINGLANFIVPLTSLPINTVPVNIINVLVGTIFVSMAGYVLFAMHMRLRNALFWAKVFLILSIVNNIIGLSFGTEGMTSREIRLLVRGMINSSLWLLYLCISKQVKRILPISYRKVSWIDSIVLVLIIASAVITILACSLAIALQ